MQSIQNKGLIEPTGLSRFRIDAEEHFGRLFKNTHLLSDKKFEQYFRNLMYLWFKHEIVYYPIEYQKALDILEQLITEQENG